ncbi:MAG: hypothetical protein AAGA21_04795 [Pseudomonadota bacterium]
MTLVLAISGPWSMWMLTDRRLSAPGKIKSDNACKVMTLDSLANCAILGYAGLGMTGRGTQPSDWMSRVLRGRKLTVEQSLIVLGQAAAREFPRHLDRIQDERLRNHQIIATALIDGESRLYSLDAKYSSSRGGYHFQLSRCDETNPPRVRQIIVAGSGKDSFDPDEAEINELLSKIGACERNKVRPEIVSEHLANINNRVHHSDETVGPNCIVIWRFKRGGIRNGGGGIESYNGLKRRGQAWPPKIVNGFDTKAIEERLMPIFEEKVAKPMGEGKEIQGMNKDEMNAAIADLPTGPDERLR